jgi:hypothetical protein
VEEQLGPLGREDGASFAPPFAPPLKAFDVEAAIANVTRLLARTDDATTAADLVNERASLRDELRTMRDGEAGVIRLQDERARRKPRK